MGAGRISILVHTARLRRDGRSKGTNSPDWHDGREKAMMRTALIQSIPSSDQGRAVSSGMGWGIQGIPGRVLEFADGGIGHERTASRVYLNLSMLKDEAAV